MPRPRTFDPLQPGRAFPYKSPRISITGREYTELVDVTAPDHGTLLESSPLKSWRLCVSTFTFPAIGNTKFLHLVPQGAGIHPQQFSCTI